MLMVSINASTIRADEGSPFAVGNAGLT